MTININFYLALMMIVILSGCGSRGTTIWTHRSAEINYSNCEIAKSYTYTREARDGYYRIVLNEKDGRMIVQTSNADGAEFEFQGTYKKSGGSVEMSVQQDMYRDSSKGLVYPKKMSASLQEKGKTDLYLTTTVKKPTECPEGKRTDKLHFNCEKKKYCKKFLFFTRCKIRCEVYDFTPVNEASVNKTIQLSMPTELSSDEAFNTQINDMFLNYGIRVVGSSNHQLQISIADSVIKTEESESENGETIKTDTHKISVTLVALKSGSQYITFQNSKEISVIQGASDIDKKINEIKQGLTYGLIIDFLSETNIGDYYL